MASAEFSLRELAGALDRVSAEAKQAIADLVGDAAQAAAAEIMARYPARTGVLRSRVTARAGGRRGTFETPINLTWTVRSWAPHVHFIEEYTGLVRRDNTRKNASRGIMPKLGPIFVPTVIRHRAAMVARAQAILASGREL